MRTIKKIFISCLTAYSSSISKIVDEYVDIILVGDSLGNAVYGMKNTQSVHFRYDEKSRKSSFSIF